jgi:restriction endonuclease S subunit
MLKDKMIQLASGGTFKEISKTNLGTLQIPRPPLSIQNEIVEEIKSYQKIIDGARQVVENYKPRIDIDPEWPMVELGKVCKELTDGSHFSPPTTDIGFPYITVKNLKNGDIDFVSCKKISKEDYETLVKSGCKPEENDILFSKDGTVGKTALITSNVDFVVLSSLAILTPNTNNVLPEFLYQILSTDWFISKAIENKTGVAIRRIVLKTLKTILIPLPDLATQKKIVDIMNNEIKLINSSRSLIQIYEQKIKDRIAKVWEQPTN